MIQNFYNRIAGIDITRGVIAYVGVIILYTLVPQSVDVARNAISTVALVMLLIIAIAVIDRLRSEF